ncbi:putative hybrid sensor and regulator protein [Azoarcus olearius]|uniref:ATP-binding protein n=1 Tax=Azoarcus sp. (strain BH72) TaxID=418699 RepID=UPI00080622E3|nr:ATP-binding protein [Azoarcus olearius]ANQ83228.1 putative hybrid sensor and regulator protein [Azoarcus olearius]
MSRLKSIGAELGLLFLVVALAPIVTAYYVANDIFGEAIRQEKREALTAIADAAHGRIESYVRTLISDTTTLAKSPKVGELLSALEHLPGPSPATAEFLRAYREEKGYYDVMLVDHLGNIRLSLSQPEVVGQSIQGELLRGSALARTIDTANTLLQTEVSNFAHFPPSKGHAAFLAAPVFAGGVIIGNAVLQIDNRELDGIINRFGGLGESGEVLVGTIENAQLLITAPPRHDATLRNRQVDAARFAPLRAALEGSQGTGGYTDYRGHDTLAVWRYLPSLNWGMLVKIDTAELYAPIRRFEAISLMVMVASVLLVLFGVALSNRLVSRPLVRFAQTVKALDEESLPAAVNIDARHEIRDLVTAFNTLIGSVRSHQHQLEARVSERTAELATANAGLARANLDLQESNAELAVTLDELQRTHRQLVESEKLATLGQLIAGIAHEINTPLGSIASSIDTIIAGGQQQTAFLALYAGLGEDHRALVCSLLDVAATGSSLSLKEKRALKKDYETRLAEHPAVDARKAAELLSHLPPLDLERYLPLLTHPEAGAILDQVKHAMNLHRASHNIKLASEKARKVVFALKNFARFGDHGSKTPTRLRDSIDTVLTLYHNQIKQAVDLRAELPDLPPIPAYADELGQVWMNLIHNALQAMDYCGRLDITLEQDAERAVVRISDTGCGIPEEIRERIFQPFFTTKPAGEGSGLGLDIVRKILDKHGGSIRVESAVGRGSTFEVTLPATETA